jgi:hypothetical protein
MADMIEGEKLPHIQAPNFISEYADQIVGIGFGTGSESKVSLNFGRERIDILNETLKEISPGEFQSVIDRSNFSVTRQDFATISMSIEAAKRLAEVLAQIISAPQHQ